MFQQFLKKHGLNSVNFNHSTYHHFTGDGLFDSQIDVLLYQQKSSPDILDKIICKIENPLLASAHDIVFSSHEIPQFDDQNANDGSENIEAIRVTNNRVKIIWDEKNIHQYKDLVSHILPGLCNTWADPSSKSSISILLKATNDALSSCAVATNKFVKLGKNVRQRPFSSIEVRKAQQQLLRLSKHLRELSLCDNASPSQLSDAKSALSSSRSAYRRLANSTIRSAADKRDSLVHSVLSSNPAALYKSIRAFQTPSGAKLHSLKVSNKV